MNTKVESAGAEVAVPLHVAQLRSALVAWEEYRAANTHIFPSAESWRWFVRQHRDTLVQRGALFFLAGKSLVRPDAMSSAIEEIGQRLAKARAA
jgi:hypothetical protein